MLLTSKLFLASGAGIFSHLFFFIHGERDQQAPFLFCAYFFCYALLVVGHMHNGLQWAVALSSLITMAYSLAIWGSMIVYRLWFHKLVAFPGPSMAGASKIWHVWRILKSPNFLEIDKLHLEYGDFVRTGPNELTVFTPEAFTAIHGPKSSCTKSVWYDCMKPQVSIHTARERKDHDRRQRIWDHGFSNSALITYRSRIQDFASELEQKVADSRGRAINVTTLFHYYAFDVMGSFAFGKSFDLMRTGKQSFAIKLLHEGMAALGFLIPVPWLFMIILRIPLLSRDWRRMLSWVAEQVEQRLKYCTNDDDVMSLLIDASQRNGMSHQDKMWLNGDALTIIVAGSGTVALSLTMIFYHLAKYPEHSAKLREELKTITSLHDVNELQSINHLNAVITETLRLFPGVPAGALRNTPPDGLIVAGQFIPGNVSVLVPCYSIGRLESCFEQADRFIPERWYLKPDMVKDKNANKPFLLGPYGCVGKNLALMQLRVVVALIVSRYDISFAPGENGKRVIQDMKDAFTMAPGRLDLSFRPIQ